MHEDGFREESGESILPVGNFRSPAALFYPSIVFPEAGALLEKGGGGTRLLTDAAFGKAWPKTVLGSVSPFSSLLMLE